MIIAAHQIHFMPGLRYFSKMKDCDVFVFLDDVQYVKREFQNRNKIRTVDGWQYLTLPVITKGRFYQKINEVEINNTVDWKTEHLKAIKINYSKAKYFNDYFSKIEDIYSKDYSKMIDLSMGLIHFFRKHFDIKNKFVFSSELDIKTTSNQRLLEICLKLGADVYLSGIGAKYYLDESLFKLHKIEIVWQNFEIKPYPQVYKGFVENMSALDLLMNCGPESVKWL
ncbi:MAG: WbqC family protein [Elusimicrobiales bacterium]